jgi:hypothetical protein
VLSLLRFVVLAGYSIHQEPPWPGVVPGAASAWRRIFEELPGAQEYAHSSPSETLRIPRTPPLLCRALA